MIAIICCILMFHISFHAIGEACRLVSSYLPAKKGEATGDKEEGVHCNDACETSGVVSGIQGKQKNERI